MSEIYDRMGYEDPIDFKHRRFLENYSKEGVDVEAGGERQTGRTTHLMAGLAAKLMNKEEDKVLVFVANHASIHNAKSILIKILEEYNWCFKNTWDTISRDGKLVVRFVSGARLRIDTFHSYDFADATVIVDEALNDRIMRG